MWITYQIDNYWFRIHARQGDNTAATIYCLQGGKTVACLSFKYGVESTEAKLSVNGDWILLDYPATMFGPILETLRSEKPLYVHMHSESKWGYITSGNEPVGEEEGQL